MWTEPDPQPLAQGGRELLYVLFRVEPPVPGKHVEALDLLDEQDDRAPSRSDLLTSIVLEPRSPAPQLVELIRLEAALPHR